MTLLYFNLSTKITLLFIRGWSFVNTSFCTLKLFQLFKNIVKVILYSYLILKKTNKRITDS